MGFASDIEKWAELTKQDIETVVKKTAIDMFSSVIFLSPVDTGRFINNWRLSIGKVDPTVNLEAIGKSKDPIYSRIQAEISGFKLGDVVYFSNNLPYAIPLEYGHSEQRPDGMVRQTVATFQKVVSKNIKAIK